MGIATKGSSGNQPSHGSKQPSSLSITKQTSLLSPEYRETSTVSKPSLMIIEQMEQLQDSRRNMGDDSLEKSVSRVSISNRKDRSFLKNSEVSFQEQDKSITFSNVT